MRYLKKGLLKWVLHNSDELFKTKNLCNWLVVQNELSETFDYIYIFAANGSFSSEKYGLSLLKSVPQRRDRAR